MSLGFQNAGFEILSAYDNWDGAIEIYKSNFQHPIHKRDLSTEDISEELKRLSPDIIIGGHHVRISRLPENVILKEKGQTLRVCLPISYLMSDQNGLSWKMCIT